MTSRRKYRQRQYSVESLERRLLLATDLTYVNHFDLWDGEVPSTDAAGITYDPVDEALVIADSEINENPEFEGNNIFKTDPFGGLIDEIQSNNSEPTGITYSSYNGCDCYYVTNDNSETVSRYDDQFNLLTSIQTSDDVSSAQDPEGVGINLSTGFIYVADGKGGGRQVLVYDSNLDYQFNFSVSSQVADPEGLAVHPATGNVFVISSPDEAVFEYTPTGTFLEEHQFDHFSPSPTDAQGITFAPTSNTNDPPGALALYMADLGVDNQPDGRVYEALLDSGPGPMAVDDLAVTELNVGVTTLVLVNDSLGTPPTNITSVTDGNDGTVTFNAGAGTTFYQPDTGFVGTDSYTYTITDSNNLTSTATVNVTVTAPNLTPSAVDDNASTPEDVAVTTFVLANDELGNEPTVVDSVTDGANGTVTFDSTTTTYTPDANFFGSDSYSYTIRDVDGETSTAQVLVMVTSVNDTPLAVDDVATTIQNVSVTSTVLDNDDLGDEPTAIIGVTDGASGTTSFNAGAGTTTYSPNPGFVGTDSYTYTIQDLDGEQSTATVDVTVTVPLMTISIPVSASSDDAEEKASGSMKLTSSDLELVFDGSLQTVGMRFNGLPIPPGAQIVSSYIQFQADENSSGATSLTIAGEATDHALTFTSSRNNISSRPTTGAAVNWNPAPWTSIGQAGPDQQTPDLSSILQEVVDRPGWADGNSVAMIVTGTGERVAESSNGSAAPVLHVEFIPFSGPNAVDDTAVTEVDTAVTTMVLTNDDLGTEPTFITAVTPGANGGVTFNAGNGTTTYTPNPGFQGPDSYTYTITDSDNQMSTATVSVTVTAPNVPPLARDDSTLTMEDMPVTTMVLLNDDLGNPPTVIIGVTDGANGTVTFTDDSATYLPDANFFGTDSYTYTIQDVDGETSTANVGVTVLPVDDLPMAVDDSDSTIQNTAVTTSVLTNDDLGDEPTAIVGVTNGASGSVTFDAGAGTTTYTPNPGFIGNDSYTYTIRDADNDESTATVNITVFSPVSSLDVRVSADSDDAEERVSNGNVDLGSSDLELVFDKRLQVVGMRFNGLTIPNGATIINAYVQFQVDEATDDPALLTFSGQAADNALTFTNSAFNVSNRPTTTNSVSWSPAPWNTVGEAGLDQQTPDLSSVIQEIVDRPGWASGNSLALIVTGSGERVAESYKGSASAAALLHVEFMQGGGSSAPAVVSGAAGPAEVDAVLEDDSDGPLNQISEDESGWAALAADNALRRVAAGPAEDVHSSSALARRRAVAVDEYLAQWYRSLSLDDASQNGS